MIQKLLEIYVKLYKRIPFYYKTTEHFRNVFGKVFCCIKSSDKESKRREKLFGLGIEKLEEQLDISRIVNSLR